ncbi:helix-turn-helix transcriptional regulator [Phormidesmis priestleyi]
MTITLSASDFWELAQEITPPTGFSQSIDPSEYFNAMPSLNKGYAHGIELCPGLELILWQEAYFEDTAILCLTRPHPWVELSVLLAGSYRLDTGVVLNAGQSHLQGSGIALGDREYYAQNEWCHCLNVHLDPALLQTFLAQESPLPTLVQTLMKDDDWQTVLPPQNTTSAMSAITQQILNCPFQGFTKRMYLQAKVLELLALQLAAFAPGDSSQIHRMKPQTVERIHAAKNLLLTYLEQPPTITELAQRVGVSDRTLQRGFQELFGTTVFGYLTDQRMVQAEHGLRSGQSVAEVANLVGYSNPGHFAAAFKRKFGITPSECGSGKKSVLR